MNDKCLVPNRICLCGSRHPSSHPPHFPSILGYNHKLPHLHTQIVGDGLLDEFLSAPSFLSQWRSAHAHQFHSLDQDQSKVAQQAEMTEAERSLRVVCELVFPEKSHTMTKQHSQPTLAQVNNNEYYYLYSALSLRSS